MKSVEIKIEISNGPDRIWSILTDAEALQDGDTGILKITGQVGPSENFRLWSEVSPERAFVLRVDQFEAPKIMTWVGGMPLGLFTGKRTFSLREMGAETELHIREEFTGPLSGLIWKSMPDLNPSFAKLAEGIKKLAERAQG